MLILVVDFGEFSITYHAVIVITYYTNNYV